MIFSSLPGLGCHRSYKVLKENALMVLVCSFVTNGEKSNLLSVFLCF